MDSLIEKIDACGKQECDIVCLWEYVWYRKDDEVETYKERNQERLARIADAAKRNNLYIVIAGELECGFNESIVYDRQGKEIGRYTKINQTTSKASLKGILFLGQPCPSHRAGDGGGPKEAKTFPIPYTTDFRNSIMNFPQIPQISYFRREGSPRIGTGISPSPSRGTWAPYEGRAFFTLSGY